MKQLLKVLKIITKKKEETTFDFSQNFVVVV